MIAFLDKDLKITNRTKKSDEYLLCAKQDNFWQKRNRPRSETLKFTT